MSNKELILNICVVIANLILIGLCFAIAIIKNWWLCLLIPILFNFKIERKDDKDE